MVTIGCQRQLLLLRTSRSIPSYLVLCLYLWRLIFSQNFSINLTFSHRISIGSIQMFLFSLKVTNFYRKSFGDDLLPTVAHGTNGNQWLPSAAVGCHRSPSVGITIYRWLPMGELRTHPLKFAKMTVQNKSQKRVKNLTSEWNQK